MHDQFGFANAFAGSFQQTAGTEGWLKDKDGVAATCFSLDELARRFTANFFIGGPQEDEAFAQAGVPLLKCLQSEKRLNDSRLHVKDSRSICFTGGNAEGHLPERPGRVNRVVMAQDQELTGGARVLWPIGDAEMIATMPFSNSFNADTAPTPFLGDQGAAAVGDAFFKAGRLGNHKSAQSREHLRQPRLQDSKELFGKR